MIKNFRYSSTWEDFTRAVEILKNLVDSNRAFWAVGFLSEFTLCLADEVELEKDIDDIIGNEIIYLLRWYLDSNVDGKEIEEEKILATIREGNEANIEEEELKLLAKTIRNKLELVKDAFDTNRLLIRYKVKQDAVNLKLFDIKYNIYSHNLSEMGSTDLALVNMICKKNLRGSKQGIEKYFVEHEQGESIMFICDEEDIDLLINELKEIKQKIKGERK